MALLGYPREHTVARETWHRWRTQPNPPRILTLEPERPARTVARETWRRWRTQPNPPRILTLEPERPARTVKSTE